MPLFRPTRKLRQLPRSSYSSRTSSRQGFGYTPIKTVSSSLKKTKPSTAWGQAGTTQPKNQMSFRQPLVTITQPRPPRLSSPAELEWRTRTRSESNSMTEQPTGQPSAQGLGPQQPLSLQESLQQRQAETQSILTPQKSKDRFSSEIPVVGTPTT